MRSTIIPKRCVICGKPFGVKLDENRKILTDCFYNKIDLNYFKGWSYIWKGKDIWKGKYLDDTKIQYKNKFYQIIGFCKPTRWLIYFLWKLFHKKAMFEFWECPKCANRKDD